MRRGVIPSVAAVLAVSACSEEPDRSFTGTRDRTNEIHHLDAHEARVDATTFERLGPDSRSPFEWETPPTWSQIAPTSMRDPNFIVAGGAECYVSLLQGGGGTVANNVNRWRSQMGHPALSVDEINKGQTHPLFGGPATLVDIQGTFTGMGGERNDPNYAMLGLILDLGSLGGLFVKMTGPEDVVARERGHFFAFCDSLRMSEDIVRNMGGGHSPLTGGSSNPHEQGNQPTENQPPPAATIEWGVPAGWIQKPYRGGIRTVTLAPGGSAEAECYVTILHSPGTLVQNVNRWLGEVGAPPMDEAAVAGLERIQVLGHEALIMQETGDYNGMGVSIPDAMLLGVICDRGDDVIFIKMVGPRDEIPSHISAFREFCTSLEDVQ